MNHPSPTIGERLADRPILFNGWTHYGVYRGFEIEYIPGVGCIAVNCADPSIELCDDSYEPDHVELVDAYWERIEDAAEKAEAA